MQHSYKQYTDQTHSTEGADTMQLLIGYDKPNDWDNLGGCCFFSSFFLLCPLSS